MFKEFKEFAFKGSVLDLAIGVIIGAAFGKIVSSFVADIVTPLIGLLMGKVNLSDKFIDLSGKGYSTLAEAKAAGAAVITYGNFIQAILDFVIVALVIFLVVRQINKMKREGVADPTTKECPFCLTAVPLAATRCLACTSELKA